MSKLYGLVVCGGKSSRMGMDKSMINYHGLPQRYYLYEALKSLCERVFISCNQKQADTVAAEYEVIIDNPVYKNIGPMAALLSAFESHADASFLTVGCDYPFIKKEDLKKLTEARNKNTLALSYFNETYFIAEPLLALYEKESYDAMKINFENKDYSLRFFLQEINALRINPSSQEIITSIDTQEEYRQVLEKLRNENKIEG